MVDQFIMSPIGVVKSQFDNDTPAQEIRSQQCQIVVKPEFEAGLMGLEPGRQISVLFYFDKIPAGEITLQLHPRNNPDNPLRGVFATRAPSRPNKIGMTVAYVEAVEKNVVTVSGLDALDGTPVLDIKPYAPLFDAERKQQLLEVTNVTDLDEARSAIDAIDSEIIRLLGNRAGYVRQVVRYKKTAEEVRAPARYAEVMRRRREMAEAAGLNPDVIEKMYKLLVDNFIKEELEMLGLKPSD